MQAWLNDVDPQRNVTIDRSLDRRSEVSEVEEGKKQKPPHTF
jgi:hypothetical protein